MKKNLLFITLLVIFLLMPSSISYRGDSIRDYNCDGVSVEPISFDFSFWINERMQNSFVQNSIQNPSIIDNFTWAVMRYDFNQRSENHGYIMTPTPSAGTVLIPANMMSTVVCRAALAIHRDSKMETLKAFDSYISSRVIHTSAAFTNGEDEWNTESC